MSKYLNRLAARIAREQLRESAEQAKNWIVSKKLILETEDADLELDAGDTVEVGADENGDMAVKTGAAVVVITDPELAAKIADVVVSSDELSDVNFVQKPALDAVLDGEEVDDVIDSLADDEGTDVEVPEVEIEKKESVEAKFAKFAKHDIHCAHPLMCEAIQVEDCEDKPLNMYLIKADRVMKESYTDYAKFASRVSEMKGSLQPGDREVALRENGKVMGYFDKAANSGMLFTEEEFDSVEDMDSFEDAPADLMQEVEFEDEKFEAPDIAALPEADKAKLDELMAQLPADDIMNAELDKLDQVYAAATADREAAPALADLMDNYGVWEVWKAWKDANGDEGAEFETNDVVECALKGYEESAKTGADYMKLLKNLRGLKESTVATIVGSFNDHRLAECVRVYDSKYGKYVKAMKESVDADNFIAETAEAKRFTKRFFA